MTAITRSTKIASALILALILSACGMPQLSFPGVYRLDIPQGNIVTQEMVDQLRPGLSKQQVNFIMGTPLVQDTFNQNRWDYLYSFQRGGGERVQEVLTLIFEDNSLVDMEGDFTQSPEHASFDQQPEDNREVTQRPEVDGSSS